MLFLSFEVAKVLSAENSPTPTQKPSSIMTNFSKITVKFLYNWGGGKHKKIKYMC